MGKNCKTLSLMLAIVTVLLSGIFLYRYYIQQALYKENSAHLLATYTQVNRTFTLFAILAHKYPPFIVCKGK